MGIRSIRRELEAKLASVKGGSDDKPSGKIERKWYGDGEQRLKISVRNLRVADGSDAVVTVDGNRIGELEIHSGAGRLDVRTSDPKQLSDLEVGQLVEVTVRNELHLAGTLYED